MYWPKGSFGALPSWGLALSQSSASGVQFFDNSPWLKIEGFAIKFMGNGLIKMSIYASFENVYNLVKNWDILIPIRALVSE